MINNSWIQFFTKLKKEIFDVLENNGKINFPEIPLVNKKLLKLKADERTD